MSSLSNTRFAAPRLATQIIARPNCSVVVTYFGASLRNSGYIGATTAYIAPYSFVFDLIPCIG
jgi:hypothetical protein